jgi:thiamine biosynthesis lipoprotein
MTSAPDPPLPTRAPLDRRGAITLALSLALLIVLSLWRFQSDSETTVHDFVGVTMGTSFSVRVDGDLSGAERETVRRVIQSRLDRVEELMSTYDSASELSRFNRHDTTEPYAASGALLDVLAKAHEVSDRSGGAFDVTVAPLVDAWGFGPVGRFERVPDQTLLDDLTARVGYERIAADRDAGTLSKTIPETVVDLSAIAKGYGVERVASGLEELGLTSFLVEVGGELRAAGVKRDGTPWRVGIERPDVAARGVYATLDLVDQAIATSGDYRSFYDDEGVRYAHIIDPRTGTPVRYAGASITVVHDDCAMADGWATALSVLGPEDGYDLALREGIAALFVMQSPHGFRSRATPAFLERVAAYTEVDTP